MSQHRKSWSKAEKLEAIALLKNESRLVVARKLGVSITSLGNWVNSFESKGNDGLDDKVKLRKDAELESLLRENKNLKMIVAEKELTIRIQSDLLKKKK